MSVGQVNHYASEPRPTLASRACAAGLRLVPSLPRAFLVMSAICASVLVILPPAGAASAASCPDEGTREAEQHGLLLPDCRDYEQVSPAGEGKNGNDAKDYPGAVGASPSGDRVHYFSTAPFLGAELIGEASVSYVSSRGSAGGWVTQGMEPNRAKEGGVLGYEDDLSQALVEAEGAELAAGAPPGENSFYLRSPAGAYQLLLSGPFASEFSLAGFSADGTHLIFESQDALVAGAAKGFDVANLYELDLEKPAGEQLSLVGVVPSPGKSSCSGAACVTEAQGSYAGAGGELAYLKPLHDDDFYTRSAISADGGVVFFTALPSQQLYARVGESTFAVSEHEHPARFLGATPDGEYVFYSEGGRLYEGSSGGEPPEALALYRYDTLTHRREAIADEAQAEGGAATGTGTIETNYDDILDVVLEPGSEEFVAGQSIEGEGIPAGDWIREVKPGTIVLENEVKAASAEGVHLRASSQADVLGVLGFSADGSSVYFAGIGVLAANANAFGEHAENRAGDLKEVAGNLYEWHAGAASPTFIAQLADYENYETGGDEEDWAEGTLLTKREKVGRVTPDGSTLLFADGGQLYRYRAGVGGGVAGSSLVCVSCTPGGGPTVGEAQLDGDSTAGGVHPRKGKVLTRNLSEDGDRVFFQTEAPLLGADKNGQMDVYEWEADGEGSCRSESQDDGCLYLISTGDSPEPSYFGDSSANGDDVFFFTRQQLAGSDEDDSVDVYDARVCQTGDASCEQKPPQREVPCVGEACTGQSPAGPPLATPASSQLTGNGNLTPPPPATGSSKPPAKGLTSKQKLTKALKACHKDKKKKKREACEKAARNAHGAKARKT